MKVPVYAVNGEVVDEVELPADVFGIRPNVPVMHQALVRQQANARQGTRKTKTRGEVAYSGRKVWRQKGTGRARHGSRRAPIFRGGGVTFGPRVRSHRKKMPNKMRRLALRSALSVKAAESQVIVLDQIEFEQPKTQEMVSLLAHLDLHESVLIAMPENDWAVEKSAANLGDVKTLRVQYLNVADLLGYELSALAPAFTGDDCGDVGYPELKERAMHIYEVLRRPVVTEKSMFQADLVNQYTFEVDRRATKQQVKEAVETAFDVTVMKVNIMRCVGKKRRWGRRVTRTPWWKKAIVTLAEGDSIQFFEGV